MRLNVLALADKASPVLEQFLKKPRAERETFDLALSCGDLDRDYLDFVATTVGCQFYYVNGNHQVLTPRHTEPLVAPDETPVTEPGLNLHGEVVQHGDFLLCGFEGVPSEDRTPGHIPERVMARAVARVERRLMRLRTWHRLTGRRPASVIVVSHTPPADIHDDDGFYPGYLCFRGFIERVQPRLWLHGHAHLQGLNQIQRLDLGETTIVNTYEFKCLRLTDYGVDVDYRLSERR